MEDEKSRRYKNCSKRSKCIYKTTAMKLNEVEWEIKLDNKQCVAGSLLFESDPLLLVMISLIKEKRK